MEHLDEITEMRATLTPVERTSINHPTSMVKRLKEYLNRNKDEAPKRKNSSPLALKNEKLEEEKAELTKADLGLFAMVEKLKERDGSNFDLNKSTSTRSPRP